MENFKNVRGPEDKGDIVSGPESNDIERTVIAVREFNSAMPDGLTDEDWREVFKQLSHTPGTGGAAMIASRAARIVEAYQRMTGQKIVNE